MEMIDEYKNNQNIERHKKEILEEYARYIVSLEKDSKSIERFLGEIINIEKWDDSRTENEYIELFNIPF